MNKANILTGLALLLAASQASAIVIHTNQTSFNTAVGASLLIEDLEAESGFVSPYSMLGGSYLTTISSVGGASFSNPSLNGTTMLAMGGANQITTYTFSEDITAFGIEVRDYFEFGGTSLNYSTSSGESGTLLSLFGGNLNFQYTGITDAIAFNSITLTGTTGDNGFYDNIGYALASPSAVPVPAAVWLFGSGLLGLVGVARRKA